MPHCVSSLATYSSVALAVVAPAIKGATTRPTTWTAELVTGGKRWPIGSLAPARTGVSHVRGVAGRTRDVRVALSLVTSWSQHEKASQDSFRCIGSWSLIRAAEARVGVRRSVGILRNRRVDRSDDRCVHHSASSTLGTLGNSDWCPTTGYGSLLRTVASNAGCEGRRPMVVYLPSYTATRDRGRVLGWLVDFAATVH